MNLKLKTWFEKLPKSIKTVIRSSIITTVLLALFQIGNNARKDYIILEKEELINNHQKEIQRLNVVIKLRDIQLERLKETNLQLQIELVKCQNNYNMIQSSLDDIPLPCWIYDKETKTIVYLNDAYVEQVLNPMAKDKWDLLGKPLSAVFDDKAVEDFQNQNNYVIKYEKALTKIEKSIENKRFVCWESTKYPIYQFGKMRYVGGIAKKLKCK